VGILMAAGERCQISFRTGAILLNLEAAQLEADACGISHPERVMGSSGRHCRVIRPQLDPLKSAASDGFGARRRRTGALRRSFRTTG